MSEENTVSVETRRFQILQQRVASLATQYEASITEMQLEREIIIQNFQQEKQAWEEERKGLLDQIQRLRGTDVEKGGVDEAATT